MATTAGFAIMFGAGFYEVLASALAGFISGIGVYGGKSRDAVVSCELYRVILLAVTSILCVHYLPGTMDLNVIIIASIMPSYRVWRSRMRCMIPCTATTFPVRHGCLRRL